MKTPSPNAIILDESTLEKFVCPRKLEARLFWKKEADLEKAALPAGRAIHVALATRYKHPDINDINMIEPLMMIEMARIWPDVPPDDWRSEPLAQDLIRMYNKEYSRETMSPIVDKIEEPFLFQLGLVKDIEIWWTGVVDLPFRRDGRIWVMDHKTASVFGPTYFDQFRLASAQVGYCWAFEQLTGERPQGYEINALVWRKPTKSGTGFEFGRQRFPLEAWHFDEWKKDILAKCETIVRYRQAGYFPRETRQCVDKFGRCEFLDVCTLPPNQRESVLNSSLFRTVTWNPAAKLGGSIR